jgi:drug/metabolite transporter (DMT)-like permease
MQGLARRRLSAYAKVTFAVVVWGMSFVATKVALKDVSPMTVVWLRFGIGTLILGAAALQRGLYYLPTIKELPYLALLGFLGIAFHQWLQSNGLLTAQASTTAWIVATTPVFMALIGRFFLKETLRIGQVIGIALSAIGGVVVVSAGDLASLRLGKFGTPGDILILVSAVNWAVFSALSSLGLKKFPAIWMLFYVVAIGWFFSTVLFFAVGPGLSQVAALNPSGWAGILFLGIACSGIAYLFWYDALQSVPIAQVGAFLYLEPVITVIVAGLILNETVGLASLLGGVQFWGEFGW